MTHLTAERLIDAVENVPAPVDRAHLEICDRCREEVQSLKAVMAAAVDSVPEPSPLFWDHFSSRVHQAVAAEPQRDALREPPRWWQVTVMAAAVIAAVVFTMTVRSSRPDRPAAATLAAAAVVPPGEEDGDASGEGQESDDVLDLIADLTRLVDWGASDGLGSLASPETVDRAVMELSDQEREELARLLTAELRPPPS